MTIRCSVGIAAYNDEANIGKLLGAMMAQKLYQVEITEIIVVASGCTDGTVPIIQGYAAQNPKIKLVVQEEREGKTSAMNEFLQRAAEEICVWESGDTLPGDASIESLVKLFADPKVGMTARKSPGECARARGWLYVALRLRLEHQLCLEIPRTGELIAFRKVFTHLPNDVAMDEAFVEALVIRRGLDVHYAPDAVVYNMGPETLGEFIMQRRRNYAGHLHLRRKYGYRVSSLDTFRVLRIGVEEIANAMKLIGTLVALALVEAFSRVLGTYDYYIKGRKHVVWDIAWTTKKVDKQPVEEKHTAV
jgi:cellulose synthase/poly-beta-1,6-N-acetylglucosamine synthase-like glycosyltransferase